MMKASYKNLFLTVLALLATDLLNCGSRFYCNGFLLIQQQQQPHTNSPAAAATPFRPRRHPPAPRRRLMKSLVALQYSNYSSPTYCYDTQTEILPNNKNNNYYDSSSTATATKQQKQPSIDELQVQLQEQQSRNYELKEEMAHLQRELVLAKRRNRTPEEIQRSRGVGQVGLVSIDGTKQIRKLQVENQQLRKLLKKERHHTMKWKCFFRWLGAMYTFKSNWIRCKHTEQTVARLNNRNHNSHNQKYNWSLHKQPQRSGDDDDESSNSQTTTAAKIIDYNSFFSNNNNDGRNDTTTTTTQIQAGLGWVALMFIFCLGGGGGSGF